MCYTYCYISNVKVKNVLHKNHEPVFCKEHRLMGISGSVFII